MSLETFARQLRPLRVIVCAQLALLVFVLPPMSLLLGAGPPLLGLFSAFYLLSLTGIVVLFARRRVYRIGVGRAVQLSLEALLCAPFAVNLVRKLTLAQSRRLNWLEVSQQKLSPTERQRLLCSINDRIDELLTGEKANGSESERLELLRASIRERLDVAVVE